ncbi:MAG: hypothetical protein ACXW2E_00880 [Nitrososphaeraceae archaeon]
MNTYAKQKEENANVITNPDELKKFKGVLATVTHYLQIIDDQKEAIGETISEASTIYGIDKKIIRKLANTMFKSNYSDIHEENTHFEILYEAIIGHSAKAEDPLDGD